MVSLCIRITIKRKVCELKSGFAENNGNRHGIEKIGNVAIACCSMNGCQLESFFPVLYYNVKYSGHELSLNYNVFKRYYRVCDVHLLASLLECFLMFNIFLFFSVNESSSKGSSDRLDSEQFKFPPPPKAGFSLYKDESLSGQPPSGCKQPDHALKPTGFALYVDESLAQQAPSTSKQPDHMCKPLKPFIPCDVENIPFVPKTGSILRNKGEASVVPQRNQFISDENELGVGRLNNDEEEMNAVGYQRTHSAKKHSLMIYSDEVNTVRSCVTVQEEFRSLEKFTPLKTDFVGASCSSQVTTAVSSIRKSSFVIPCDDDITNREKNGGVGNQISHLTSAKRCINKNQIVGATGADGNLKDPVVLPFIPPPENDIILGNEGKENADPENYSNKRPEIRRLSGVLQPSVDIPVEPHQLQNQVIFSVFYFQHLSKF